MLRDMWQFIVDALTHARYRVSLQLEQDGLCLRAYRNGVTWPMERVVRDDPLMAHFAERFGVVDEAIPVSPPPLETVIKSLLDLPEDNWFEVDIAEELRDLKKTDPPGNFRVDYTWSGTEGEATQHISHDAQYIGDGWFVGPPVLLQTELDISGSASSMLPTSRRCPWRNAGSSPRKRSSTSSAGTCWKTCPSPTCATSMT